MAFDCEHGNGWFVLDPLLPSNPNDHGLWTRGIKMHVKIWRDVGVKRLDFERIFQFIPSDTVDQFEVAVCVPVIERKWNLRLSENVQSSKKKSLHIHRLKVGVGYTDNRYDCVSKKVRVGTGQYFKRIEGFTAWKKSIGWVNFIAVTLSQYNQFCWMVCKTFASSRALTLISLPCCAILACSEVNKIRNLIHMNPWITFLL